MPADSLYEYLPRVRFLKEKLAVLGVIIEFPYGGRKKLSETKIDLYVLDKDGWIMKCFFVPNVFKYFISEMVAFHGISIPLLTSTIYT